jgi:hypothetical protein
LIPVLDHYISHLAFVQPIIPPNQIRNLGALTPFQILALCCISALSRTVPRAVRTELRTRLHYLLESVNVGNLWISNQANLTALLTCAMSAEIHGVTASANGSLSFLRVGLAVRMAQDLGLHRSSSTNAGQLARSCLWAATVFIDTWCVRCRVHID